MTKEIRENKNDQNIFSKGCLINFRAGKWGATAKLKNQKTNKIAESFGVENNEEENIMRTMQNLITKEDKEKLDKLNRIKNECRKVIQANTIPYPEENLFFIPKNRIENVNNFLEEQKIVYMEIAEEIIISARQMEVNFAEKYPEIYQPGKYPDQYKLRNKFHFSWNFRIFSVPDKEFSVLSPKIYKSEMNKFKAEIEEMKSITIRTVSNELMQRIKTLQKQCDSEKLSQRTINNINKLISNFENLFSDFIDVKDIENVMLEMKACMEGADAESLRNDDDFRKIIKSEITNIALKLENIPETKLKRSIDI